MSPCPWWLLAVLTAASATVLWLVARDTRRLDALVLIRETEQHLRTISKEQA